MVESRQIVSRTTEEKKSKFLMALSEGRDAVGAALLAGAHVSTFFLWRRDDTVFAQQWTQAKAMGDGIKLQEMEVEADRRAIQGTEKGIYWQGERVATERLYSDNLLMFRMKRLDPQYKDRVEVTGHDGGPLVFAWADELVPGDSAIDVTPAAESDQPK